MKKTGILLLAAAVSFSLAACGSGRASGNTEINQTQESGSSAAAGEITSASAASGGALDTADLFTERDLTQQADLDGAVYCTVKDGEDITITEEGVYVIRGEASDASVIVDAGDQDKVQLVLESVSITNTDKPCIYVKNADKVFVTTASSESVLSVTGSFTADGNTNTDAVIFSKDDLVLNGTGTLTVSSTDNGISCKDDLKITGGTINIECASDALEANDSIAVAGGMIHITTPKDGLHAENNDDNTLGYVYICGGSLNISAGDDGIHATTILQIDGGTLNIEASECMEATVVRINDGTLNLYGKDDAINAGKKSKISTPLIEINGGSITIDMGSGDTDAIDANGDLIINGGTLDITAQSPFDYDGTAEYNGGTLIVNGEETDTITNQFGGMGQMPGGNGGDPGAWGGSGNRR